MTELKMAAAPALFTSLEEGQVPWERGTSSRAGAEQEPLCKGKKHFTEAMNPVESSSTSSKSSSLHASGMPQDLGKALDKPYYPTRDEGKWPERAIFLQIRSRLAKDDSTVKVAGQYVSQLFFEPGTRHNYSRDGPGQHNPLLQQTY